MAHAVKQRRQEAGCTGRRHSLDVSADFIKFFGAHCFKNFPRLQIPPHYSLITLQVVRDNVDVLGAASLKAQLAAQSRLRH